MKLSRAYRFLKQGAFRRAEKTGLLLLFLSQCKLEEIMYSKDTWAVILTATSYSFKGHNLRQWEMRHKIPHQYICR